MFQYANERKFLKTMFENYTPDSVERKKARKLEKQVYVSQGPNFIWHIDDYNKLKPFGFPTQVPIDGFRRKVVRLNRCPSNSDRYIFRYFYMYSISHLKLVPRTIRSDVQVFHSEFLY